MNSELPVEVPSLIKELDLEKREFFIAEFKMCVGTAKRIESKKAGNKLVTPATINKELSDLAVSLKNLDMKLQRTHEDSIAAGELFIDLVLRKKYSDVPFCLESQSKPADFDPIKTLGFLKEYVSDFATACELALNSKHVKGRDDYIFPQVLLAWAFKIAGGKLTHYASDEIRSKKGGSFSKVLREFIKYCDIKELTDLDINDKYISRLVADVEASCEAL